MSDAAYPIRTNGAATRDADRSTFHLERASFRKIAAVEGLAPTAAAEHRAREFDRLGLSPQQRRQQIIDAHRPKD